MAKKLDDDIISIVGDKIEDKKPKKRKKSAFERPSDDSYKSEKSTGVKHYEAKIAETKKAKKEREEVRFYNDGEKAEKPSLKGYEEKPYEEGSLSNLYSDSGKTICMVMRVISCLLFLISPIYFIGKMFALFGGFEFPSSGEMISGVISAFVASILLVIAGFIVIALIKILQNLMALQKKNR